LDSSSIFGNFIFSFFRFIPAGPPAGALRGKSLKELRRFFRIFGNFIFHFLDSFRIFGNFTFSFFKFIPAGPPAGALRGKSLKELRSIELMSYNLES
jgi:hypothetical protein